LTPSLTVFPIPISLAEKVDELFRHNGAIIDASVPDLAYAQTVFSQRRITMSWLSQWFGPKYNDEQLASHARMAIAEDPLVTDVTGVNIASQKGVVSLTGTVHKSIEKDRIEGVVRVALRTAGLKYDRISNDLKVA
jgi:osmotically-inducible protein OsmY